MTERQQVRAELMKHAKANLSLQFRMTHTSKQITAACKVIVDRSIAQYLKLKTDDAKSIANGLKACAQGTTETLNLA